MKELIKWKGISFGYQEEKKVLKDVDLSIQKGEKPSSDFKIVERVCNIFRHRFSVPFSIQTPAVKGLRRASEATTTCLVPKYCKIGEMGILAHFPTGKPKTSDFFATKHGCLP